MIRTLVLVLVLTLLADSAFGDINNLLRAIGLGGPRVSVPIGGVGVGVGNGLSWRTPLSDGYIGYGYGR